MLRIPKAFVHISKASVHSSVVIPGAASRIATHTNNAMVKLVNCKTKSMSAIKQINNWSSAHQLAFQIFLRGVYLVGWNMIIIKRNEANRAPQ